MKNSRSGHPAQKFLFLTFPEILEICVVRSLTAYVERKKGLRKSTQLLMSYISQRKAISSQSVSRWLPRTLRMAGTELGYTDHSTGKRLPLLLPRQDCLLNLSWKQRTGLPCRPLNVSVTENHLLVPSRGLCLTVRLISVFTSRNTSLLCSSQEASYCCRTLSFSSSLT